MTKIQVCKINQLPTLKHQWQIHIEDLIISCLIGVYEHEHGRKQRICINMLITYSTARNTHTTYEDVICYDNLIQRITELCLDEHTELIEQLILKIVDDIAMDSRIQAMEIKVAKLEAIKSTKSVGLSYKFERPPIR